MPGLVVRLGDLVQTFAAGGAEPLSGSERANLGKSGDV